MQFGTADPRDFRDGSFARLPQDSLLCVFPGNGWQEHGPPGPGLCNGTGLAVTAHSTWRGAAVAQIRATQHFSPSLTSPARI